MEVEVGFLGAIEIGLGATAGAVAGLAEAAGVTEDVGVGDAALGDVVEGVEESAGVEGAEDEADGLRRASRARRIWEPRGK